MTQRLPAPVLATLRAFFAAGRAPRVIFDADGSITIEPVPGALMDGVVAPAPLTGASGPRLVSPHAQTIEPTAGDLADLGAADPTTAGVTDAFRRRIHRAQTHT